MWLPTWSVTDIQELRTTQFRSRLFTIGIAVALVNAIDASPAIAQQLRAGKNVNMVGGPVELVVQGNEITKIIGEPTPQRDNEPSMACAPSNPQMCLGASNSTRLVNLPLSGNATVTGDSWIAIYWNWGGVSTPGQPKQWKTTLLPGFPNDGTAFGKSTPIHGREAAADPTVRAFPGGWYVSGIAFNRADVNNTESAGVENKKGVAFIAVILDPGDPTKDPTVAGIYTADDGGSGQFLDKTWITTLASGGNLCGTLVFGETVFTGNGTNNQSKVIIKTVNTCSDTWPQWTIPWKYSAKVSESYAINQSVNLFGSPDGSINATWRVFATANLGVEGQILHSKSGPTTPGKSWSKPSVVRSFGLANASRAPDQVSLPAAPPNDVYRMFRTNAYPTGCVTSNGVTYVAFSERPDPYGYARVKVAKLQGNQWNVTAVDDAPGLKGNQLQPALTCSGRILTVAWVDQRNDSAPRAFDPPWTSNLFGTAKISDNPLTYQIGRFVLDPIPPPPTNTMDIRAARSDANGNFRPSIQVSRYRFGRIGDLVLQTEYDAVNWPMFGKLPFISDYIDLVPDRTLVPYTKTDGSIGYRPFAVNPDGSENTAEATESVVTHVTWTDNRDAIPSYFSFGSDADPNTGGTSHPPEPTNAWLTTDATGNQIENWQAAGSQCVVNGVPTANKNQNVYTAALVDNVVAGVLDESSTASGLRAYGIFVGNTTTAARQYNVSTDHGSFSLTDSTKTSLSLEVPGNNTRAVTLFLPSDPPVPVTIVTVQENVTDGFKRSVIITPSSAIGGDPETHDVSLTVFDGTVQQVDNPIFDPTNPIFDPANPIFDPTNPIYDPANPIYDPANPIYDPANPIYDPANPIYDPTNPIFDPTNPIYDPANPIFDPTNTTPSDPNTNNTVYEQPKVTQLSSFFTNDGNIASGYDFYTAIAALPGDLIWQLVIARVSVATATGNACDVHRVPRIETVTNVGMTGGQNTADSSLVLQSGESAFVLIRIYHQETYDGQPFTFNPQQASITVTAQADPNASAHYGNHAPVASNASPTTNEDTPVAINLVATDADGNTLTYDIVSGPTYGTLSGTAPSLTYTPDANYNGSDNFTFRANDGVLNSNLATVSITVTPVNDAPTAANNSYSTNEDVQLVVAAPGVLGNDTDVDGDTLAAVLVSGPAHGSLTLNANGSFTYTPAANYNSSDSFTYKANDGSVDSNVASVTITITLVNDAPVANSQSVTTAENTAVAITLTAADVEGDPLTYTIVTPPTHGTLTGSGANRTYTPQLNYVGPDSFTFGVNDGALNSNTATVSITVTPGYGFNGLLAPYQPPPKKTWNLGQAVPLVWQYTDTNGVAIDSSAVRDLLAIGFVRLGAVGAKNCSGAEDPSTQQINRDFPGNSNFQYFTAANPHPTAGANTWQFNWQLIAPVTAGCWNGRVILDLNHNGVFGDTGDQVNGPFQFLVKP
ncbi:MAG TPA: Ig-like domain-containing protein [Vicinamibacterales bacterium]|nr:Ig-like domain-containing protein [Vicinamibacterales bacterium]